MGTGDGGGFFLRSGNQARAVFEYREIGSSPLSDIMRHSSRAVGETGWIDLK